MWHGDPCLSSILQARAITGYHRVLYCRCVHLPGFEFDFLEIFAESAAPGMTPTARKISILRDIIDGGESEGHKAVPKLVVPVFARSPCEDEEPSLEGLLVCHHFDSLSNPPPALTSKARASLDSLADSLSPDVEDDYFWYEGKRVNGALRVVRNIFRPDSASLCVRYCGANWQAKAWGTAEIKPGVPGTFADTLVEAYNSAVSAVMELMPADLKLHSSSPEISLGKRDSREGQAADTAQQQLDSDTIVLREIFGSDTVSILVQGHSGSLSAKAWGTELRTASKDQEVTYQEAYSKAEAALHELLLPSKLTEDIGRLAYTSAPEICLLETAGVKISEDHFAQAAESLTSKSFRIHASSSSIHSLRDERPGKGTAGLRRLLVSRAAAATESPPEKESLLSSEVTATRRKASSFRTLFAKLRTEPNRHT